MIPICDTCDSEPCLCEMPEPFEVERDYKSTMYCNDTQMRCDLCDCGNCQGDIAWMQPQ